MRPPSSCISCIGTRMVLRVCETCTVYSRFAKTTQLFPHELSMQAAEDQVARLNPGFRNPAPSLYSSPYCRKPSIGGLDMWCECATADCQNNYSVESFPWENVQLAVEFGRCTHWTSKICNIGACWNIGESASASRRCRCCEK